MSRQRSGERYTLRVQTVERVEAVSVGDRDGEAGRVDEGGVAGVAVEDAVVVSSDGGGVREVVVDKLRQQFVNKRNARVVGIVLLIQKQV